jgi:lipoprotein-anchoring transpeptidase ErfK/SrfK
VDQYLKNQTLSRRALLCGLGTAVLLPGCVSYPQDELVGPVSATVAPDGGIQPYVEPEPLPPAAPYVSSNVSPELMYGPVVDEGFNIPAIPFAKIDPKYYRQIVSDPTGEAPGTLVVDTANRFLYFVMPFGVAMRYGVGIGREGFAWSGNANVQWKQKWPKWTPPAEMIARDKKLEKYSEKNGGRPGGIDNPLGARALYIFKDGVDTLYRIHGSPEWKSIGKAASSGCVRLMNQDVIDLYERVPNKSPVIVLDQNSPLIVS